MIVLHTAEGKSQRQIAGMLGASVATVKRTRARWREGGEAALVDRREDNGPAPKADDAYAADLLVVLRDTPREHGHRRPPCTHELFNMVTHARGHAPLSRTTRGRLLRRLGVRRGMARPAVGCPWGKRARDKRLRMIRRLVARLPEGQAAVWEDELDVHLNPKIGPDWMLPGTQRRVMTPGKNVKRYVAGAMDAKTDRLAWATGDRKNSGLFIALLSKLLKVYAGERVIHVILDNYKIHGSAQARAWLAEHGGRIRLHFLPPYCPDDNRIERRVWREVHANVTRNHTCGSIDELMDEVAYHLTNRNRAAQRRWLRSA
jgi:transposase